MPSLNDNLLGRQRWRQLELLAEDPLVSHYTNQVFPTNEWQVSNGVDRRNFLRLMAASMCLGGVTLSGCRRWPVEEIRPHGARPAGTAPGVPEMYATSFENGGISQGLLAKSYDGRPIKLEGNPLHPGSLGATTPQAQASLLQLYDPERCHCVRFRKFDVEAATPPEESERSWADFDAFASSHFRKLRERRGAGLAILVQPSDSPTWSRLREEFMVALPQAKWCVYQPIHREQEFAGSRLAFGQVLRAQYRMAQAQLIACFDCDLLGSHPAQLSLARGWAEGRRLESTSQSMNRMYVVEPSFSITGSVADLRLPMKVANIGLCLAYLATRLGLMDPFQTDFDSRQVQFLDQLAVDLANARGASLVAVGQSQPPEVHRLAHALNQALDNFGKTITFTLEPLAEETSSWEGISQLNQLLQSDSIATLLIVGGNPAYDAPADARLKLSNERSGLTTIHLSDYDNETSQQSTWTLPAAHFLECWGDGRAWDGTYSIQQPLIEPLFGGKSACELLALLMGQKTSGLALVRSTFDQLFPTDGNSGWEQSLHDGLRVNSGYAPVVPPTVLIDRQSKFTTTNSGTEVCFVPDFKIFDGRFSNNAWLQELPDPITKLTWDNAARVSITDAAQWGIKTGDLLRIAPRSGGSPIEIAAFVAPGQAAGSIQLPLGYGKRSGGLVGQGVGFDVQSLRGLANSYVLEDVTVTKTGGYYPLVTTQMPQLAPSIADFALTARLGERGKPGLIVHECLWNEFQLDAKAVHGHTHTVHPAPLFDPPSHFDQPHKWGMAIDLNACIGCAGCTIACQAENNIPVVGKTNVAKSREMHWMRIDRYFKGPVEDPDVVHLPMACAHCENAPCEQVCPVAATVHDAEGLNGMVYNRCIGTRYCANNCPYKVRRFNYFDYHASHPRTPAKPWLGIPDQQQTTDVSPLTQLMFNPEVSVRMRGVMEKCTYCLQRIVAARIQAKNEQAQGLRESDLVNSSELQTACQASCPTQAIVFGDLNDTHAAVSQAKANIRNYEIVEELNLKARTTYLAKVRNR